MGLELIEVGAFCNLHQVSILYLKDNKLQFLPELCSLKCCLVKLSLSNNWLSNLDDNFFEGYKILESVHLSNNKLLALPELHWIKHSIINLYASDNKIKSLDVFNVIGIFELLSYIDMGGNSIRVFNAAILRHMPKLSNLRLCCNQLTSIDDFRIYYKKKIYLVGNPWHCGTTLSWMGEDDMAFEVGLVCETPTCVQGIAIADMSKYIKRQDIHKDVQHSVL